MAVRTIRLTVRYDGTGYAGWQIQPEKRTIQGVIVRTFKDTNLNQWFIAVKTYKLNNSNPSEREFLFMKDEIKSFRLLK